MSASITSHFIIKFSLEKKIILAGNRHNLDTIIVGISKNILRKHTLSRPTLQYEYHIIFQGNRYDL